jgi:two-component system, chemotaxis family, sensor kinase CheA
MSMAKDIREQLLKSFRAELAEHVQTMTVGLLAIEQATAQGQTLEQEMLNTTFRAAHSLKGAARAMGVTAIEQLAHALENILDGLRRSTMATTPELFTACYQGLDAIQAVQAAYEAGETTPPISSLMALAGLEKVRTATPPVAAAPVNDALSSVTETTSGVASTPTAASVSAPLADVKAQPAAAAPSAAPAEQTLLPVEQSTNVAAQAAAPAATDETIRVDVQKLDALMANLSELLVARIRLEQRHEQIHHVQDQINKLLRAWSPVRGPFSRLSRQQENGLLSLHRPRSVDAFVHDNNGSGDSSNGVPKATNMGRLRTTSNALTRLTGVREEIRPDSLPSDLKGLVELGKDAATLLRYVSSSQEQMRSLYAQVGDLARLYTADTLHLSLVIDELEEEIKRLRMLPFSTITTPFARMVRDLARQSNKEAMLTILGGDTEVDKRILEGVKDPLTHLLRNAIDHGIEKPDQRAAAGKPRIGQITLSAEQSGKEIVVRIADDGAGLDMEAIRQAVTRSQSSQRGGRDPHSMSEAELIDAMFSLGLSTSRIITDVSGRGIGLNVVRSNIESLHGRIDVESRPREGTTFTLILPLALTGTRGLLVRSAGQLFALPINTVERTLSIQTSDIFTVEGHDAIQYDGHPVKLVRLSEVLELHSEAHPGAKSLSAVILSVNDRLSSAQGITRQARQVAFIIDELTGEQEVVIKDLGKQLTRVAGISGATVMGNGEVVLVLNASDLMKLTMRRGQSSILETLVPQIALEANVERKTILVVDDSITTRTLEKNILEAAGYRVMIATDGYEALGVIRSTERPNLVVTDIVMPRMDGFELTRQIKTDAQLANLPVILVTSLDSAEDKERGIEVQADAYIVKSSFDQVNLLDTIEQLI